MCTGMRHHHPSTSPGWTDRRTPKNRTGQIRSPSPGWLWVHRGGNGGLWLPGDFQVFYHVKVTLKCFARAPGCAEKTYRAPSYLLREALPLVQHGSLGGNATRAGKLFSLLNSFMRCAQRCDLLW